MRPFSRLGQEILPSSTLAIDTLYKSLKASGVDVIGFGAGEPDFDTPESVREAGKRAIDEGLTRYTPVAGTGELRDAICGKLRRDYRLEYGVDQIVVSNGAKQSLFNALFALLDPGDEVLIPSPYWISYPEMVRMCNGVPVFIETRGEGGFRLPLERLESLVTPRTKVLVLNSPGNPTGTVYTRGELSAVAEFVLRHDLHVLSDDIYEKLLYDGREFTSLAMLGEELRKRTVVINGVSKSHAMTGWRIGYSASSRELAQIMVRVQSHMTSNSSSIGQAAATEALRGSQDSVGQMRDAFQRRRDAMVRRIRAMPEVDCAVPEGAFYVMMDIRRLKGRTLDGQRIASSDDLCSLLLRNARIALVPGSGFGTDDHVRLSFATSEENIERGMDRLEDCIRNSIR